MKWEYKVISRPSLQDLEDFLNGLGQECWELVQYDHDMAIFKRWIDDLRDELFFDEIYDDLPESIDVWKDGRKVSGSE